MMITKRKPRKDCNHLVYQLECNQGVYIGVTAIREGSPQYALKRRWTRHVSRAFRDGLDWPLCKAIRKHGADSFDVQIVSIVRGKTKAHELERVLINKYNPKLNSK